MPAKATETTPAVLHKGSIDWLSWGPDAFRRAVAQDKLLLVDVGAVWCHWCHVMDRTTYDDARVAQLVNEKFIPVRVDRDQRPDIDSRLQRAAPVVGGQGNGWPLTVVLTPDGRVLFKATYLPPTSDSRLGIGIGLVELLGQLDKIYREGRDQLAEAGQSLEAQIEKATAESSAQQAGEVADEAVKAVLDGIVGSFDSEFGGFGSGQGPKFPHCAAADLCMIRATRAGRKDRGQRVAVETLSAMARGGIHDQLGGGFHRYSVDRRWRVPHFEKMASDNAGLLGNYVRAFGLTGEAKCREVAQGIIRFTGDVLYDHQAGGFFGSQDADISLHDDGDYFTWSLAEVRSVLSGEELEVAFAHFGIDEAGDMESAPGRNVLRVDADVASLARRRCEEASGTAKVIGSAKGKLLAARNNRPMPWVDKTLFADWNGGYIRAMADAYRLIEPNAQWLTMARRSADRVLRECRADGDGGLLHYALPAGPRAHGAGECTVAGQLSDHAWMAWGLLGLFSIAGDAKDAQAIVRLLDHIVNQLVDTESGGFFDSPGPADATAVLKPRQKVWEDTPAQSANSIACLALLEASQYFGRADYADIARRAVASFAGAIRSEIGLFVAGWALAADMLMHPPAHVLIVAPAASEPRANFLRAAWSAAGAGWVLTEPVDPAEPAGAARLAALGIPLASGQGTNHPVAYVCDGKGSCRPPVYSSAELTELLPG
jgi:uncharacterized protein YyaL (SSP411 family)